MKGNKLLKYSKELVDYEKKNNPGFIDEVRNLFPNNYLEAIGTLDHFICNIFTDLMQMLPYILEEVPVEIVNYFGKPGDENAFLLFLDKNGFVTKELNRAISWKLKRSFDLWFLVGFHHIEFTRTGNKIYLKWECKEKVENGFYM